MKTMSKTFRTLFVGGLIPFFSLVAISHAGAQTCVQPPPSLVSWWPGDGNADDIQNGNDGTLQNGATFAAGMVGQAFSLDGVDDHVRIPHNANLNPSGAFTVDFWMKGDPTQSDPLYNVIDKSHGFSDGSGWTFQGESSSGILGFGYGWGGLCNCGSPADFTGVGTTVDVLDDQFHHIAGVFTGNEIQIYVDGVLNNSILENRPPVNNTRDVFIGRAFGGGTPQRHFRGLVDEVEFYSRALSAAEVQAIYNAGSAGKCNIVIDIKPGTDSNSINPRSKGVIQVAILTTDTFDATTVDPTTVLFGPTGTEAAPVQFALDDVDGDGDTDMILHFNTQATGIQCGDTSASLTGETSDGSPIRGSDSINTVGC